MKKFHDQDLYRLKNSILTEKDLFWLLRQVYLLADFIYRKNKSRQKEAIQLFFTVEKLIQSQSSVEIRFYAALAEIQFQFRESCGKSNGFWSMFYRDHCDRKILLMEKDKDHHTFARGLATIMQVISDSVSDLFVTRISESGKKELNSTLDLIDKRLPSEKEIMEADQELRALVTK